MVETESYEIKEALTAKQVDAAMFRSRLVYIIIIDCTEGLPIVEALNSKGDTDYNLNNTITVLRRPISISDNIESL
jgi:hypothetical protein